MCLESTTVQAQALVRVLHVCDTTTSVYKPAVLIHHSLWVYLPYYLNY